MITEYTVEGMTCGHCVAAVEHEITRLDRVRGVTIDLVSGGKSRVTVDSETPLAREQVAAALDEAGGYLLVDG